MPMRPPRAVRARLALVAVVSVVVAVAALVPLRADAQLGPSHRGLDTTMRAMLDRVLAAEYSFFAKFDSTWRFSERDRHPFLGYSDAQSEDGSRHQNFHCHADLIGLQTAVNQGRLIRSTRTWFSVCPSFDLGDVRTSIEERLELDQALTPARRPAIREARTALIALIDTAVRAMPSSNFLVGQHVRFLLDEWDFDGALRVARDCRADAWWCAALTGYVHAARREVLEADTAFTRAMAAAPEDVRCEWTDFSLLVDFEARGAYRQASCRDRQALNTRFWWLSDPLYIEPGNERKIEQYVRRVWLALRTELDRDERFSWLPELGNDARAAMVTRYGWPSYAYWGGPFQDGGHTGYLATRRAPPNEPYTTYEYFGPRIRTTPLWSAVERPFEATPRSWAMTRFASLEDGPERVVASTTATPVMFSARAPAPARNLPRPTGYWWPIEHFQPRRPLVQLQSGQQALLRRYSSAFLATATDLVPDWVERVARDTINDIAVVTSPAPDSVRRVAEVRGVVGRPLVITAPIPVEPALVSVEYRGTAGSRGLPGGRLRFGVQPPPPLSALRPGEVAVSTPVLLRAPTDDSVLPNEVNAALSHMRTTRTLGPGERLGIYWETYGFRAADTVEIAIWVERATSQSVLRRFGVALGVATDANTPVSVSWREPQPGFRSHVFSDGGVMIIGRAVAIDLSSVQPGEYRLEVAVRRGTGEPVRGRTTVEIREEGR